MKQPPTLAKSTLPAINARNRICVESLTGLEFHPLEEIHEPDSTPPIPCSGSYYAHRVALDGFAKT